MRLANEHPAISMIGLFVGTLFLARLIQRALGLDFAAGPLIGVGLITSAFILAHKITSRERENSRTAREIHQVRVRTARLERELRRGD